MRHIFFVIICSVLFTVFVDVSAQTSDKRGPNVILNRKDLLSGNAKWLQYSRANDDSFLLEDGDPNEEYEVALQTCGLEPIRRGRGFEFQLKFLAQMVTGKYLEAAPAFELIEVSNSIRKPSSQPASLVIDGDSSLIFAPIHEKKDKLIVGALTLGVANRQGNYKGEVHLRVKADAQIPEEQRQLFKDGVFQKIYWKITLIQSGDRLQLANNKNDWIRCVRQKEPLLKEWSSNFKKIAKPTRFRIAPEEAVCLEETIGNGNIQLSQNTVKDEFAAAILGARCLECHSPVDYRKLRNKDKKDRDTFIQRENNNRLFCPNGTPVRPLNLANFVNQFIPGLTRTKINQLPEKYKRRRRTLLGAKYSMHEAFLKLREIDEKNQSVQNWLDWQLNKKRVFSKTCDGLSREECSKSSNSDCGWMRCSQKCIDTTTEICSRYKDDIWCELFPNCKWEGPKCDEANTGRCVVATSSN